MRLKPKKTPELIITYGFGKRAKDARPKAYETSWTKFIDHLCESLHDDFTDPLTGHETKDEYDAYKNALPYISAEFGGKRGNDNVEARSLIYIDLDKYDARSFKSVLADLEERGLTYFAHTTTGDRHDLKDGTRCYRILLPTDRPMTSDEIYDVQCKLTNSLGLWDVADVTAHQRARIMFCPAPGARTWRHDGKPVRVNRVLRDTWEPPSESGSTNWTEAALANADENSRAIADWCFEEGLEPLPSSRGWAVTCPNWMEHSDGEDGTNGSTAIMLPDATHPEVRFVCQHAHCKDHNRHQHLVLGLVGVPAPYLPEAHNISRKQLETLLPSVDDEELDRIYQAETEAAAYGPDAHTCTDEDLADKMLYSRRDPLIEGMFNFSTVWHTIGESNIGKSFYVLGQMAAVAAGIPFAGAGVRKSHCFYFDAEGGETTKLRKEALAAQYGDDLDWLHIIDMQARNWDITGTAGINAAVQYIMRTAGNDPVGMVAFDSLNQTVSVRKFDENSSGDMGELVAGLKAISTRTGGAVGVIHHPAKGTTDSPRGSTALHAAVDSAFCVELPDTDQPLHLNVSHLKSRNGIKQRKMGFMLAKYAVPGVEDIQELSRTGGPDFTEHLEGRTPQPVFIPKSNETLWLIPVAVAPFDTPAAEAGREAVKKAQEENPVEPKGSTQASLYAVLEQMPDRDYGYTLNDIINFDRRNKASLSKDNGSMRSSLKKMSEAGLLVHGVDREQNTVGSNYRIASKINDLQRRELVASDGDLED